MKKLFILLFLVLVTLPSYADFAPYYAEADVKCKLKKSEDYLVPDFPKEWEGKISLCLVCVDGVNYYNYYIPEGKHDKNKDALCHIVYNVSINDSVNSYVGKLAKQKELTSSQIYQDITKTNKPIWIFHSKDYVDGDTPCIITDMGVDNP